MVVMLSGMLDDRTLSEKSRALPSVRKCATRFYRRKKHSGYNNVSQGVLREVGKGCNRIRDGAPQTIRS